MVLSNLGSCESSSYSTHVTPISYTCVLQWQLAYLQVYWLCIGQNLCGGGCPMMISKCVYKLCGDIKYLNCDEQQRTTDVSQFPGYPAAGPTLCCCWSSIWGCYRFRPSNYKLYCWITEIGFNIWVPWLGHRSRDPGDVHVSSRWVHVFIVNVPQPDDDVWSAGSLLSISGYIY